MAPSSLLVVRPHWPWESYPTVQLSSGSTIIAILS